MRVRDALGIAELGAHPVPHRVGIETIARRRPRRRHSRRGSHHPHLVHRALPAGFDQHRRLQHRHIRLPRPRSIERLHGQTADLRPDDIGEPPQLPRIGEYALAQRPAVDAPIGADDFCAECLHNLGERRLPRRIGPMAEGIGIHHRRPARRQMPRRRGFAGADAAGEADDEQRGRPAAVVGKGRILLAWPVIGKPHGKDSMRMVAPVNFAVGTARTARKEPRR